MKLNKKNYESRNLLRTDVSGTLLAFHPLTKRGSGDVLPVTEWYWNLEKLKTRFYGHNNSILSCQVQAEGLGYQ